MKTLRTYWTTNTEGEIELTNETIETPTSPAMSDVVADERLLEERLTEAACALEAHLIGGEPLSINCAIPAHLRQAVRVLTGFRWAAGMYEDRFLTRDEIGAELHDFQMIIPEVSKVYNHVTGGRISKPNTHAFEVISASDDYITQLVKDKLEDLADINQ